MTKFAYKPKPGDAISTEMFGLVFEANMPVEVTDKHGIDADVAERFAVDGVQRSRTVRKWIPAAELLRHNPHFVEIVVDNTKTPGWTPAEVDAIEKSGRPVIHKVK